VYTCFSYPKILSGLVSVSEDMVDELMRKNVKTTNTEQRKFCNPYHRVDNEFRF
jgi:hypothetical protein